MQFARKKRKPPFINIISLIDILVVLLIFYIVTTVFKKPQPVAKIHVPESNHTANEAQGVPPDTLYLTIDKKLFLEAEPIKIEDLADILKAKIKANPDYKIALKADEGVPFGTFIKVTDALSSCGITDLSTYMNKPAPAGGSSQ
jgi:biopolymer transport protein ExbD